jgi:hypothetical protein
MKKEMLLVLAIIAATTLVAIFTPTHQVKVAAQRKELPPPHPPEYLAFSSKPFHATFRPSLESQMESVRK